MFQQFYEKKLQENVKRECLILNEYPEFPG